jgi:site-specific DNA recombinase
VKAAIYVRVSTEEQAEEGRESLEAQVSECLALCQRQGYEPLPIYQDVQSGADDQKKRPAFERMLADIRAGLVDVVVAWNGDRLFRGLRPYVDLRDALEATDCGIEAVKEALDRGWLGIRAAIAEKELESIRMRVRMGMRGRARRGKYACGIAPYGYAYRRCDCEGKGCYNPEHGKLVVDEGEAATVRYIYSLYVEEGMAVRAITRRLNAEKRPTRGGAVRSEDGTRKGWVAAAVSRILTASTYKGVWQYGRRRNGRKGTKKVTKQEDFIDVPVTAIISEELWEQARAKAERNKHHGQGHEAKSLFYLLRGLLYCDECGRPFRCLGTPAGRRKPDKEGRTYTVHTEYRGYGCRGQGDHPDLYQCRKPQFVRAERLEEPVWERVVEILRDPALLRQACADDQAEQVEATSQTAARIAKRHQQVNALMEKRRGVIELAGKDFLQGVLREEDVRKTLERLNAEIAMWQDELDRLERGAAAQARTEEATQALEAFCQDIRPTLAVATPAERREILLTLVEKVWVSGDGEIRLEGIIPAARAPRVLYQERRR